MMAHLVRPVAAGADLLHISIRQCTVHGAGNNDVDGHAVDNARQLIEQVGS